MQAFQQDLEKFESLNAQVLGISPDDVDTHRKFSKELGLRFPLIADTDKGLQKMYKPGRVTFVIDKQGIIRFIQEGMPKNDDLLREIEKMEQKGK
jgi:thioredoxin-dependent peroxiredoxin